MVFSRLVRGCSLAVLVLSSFLPLDATATSAQTASGGAKKPNIMVIFGDDVGYWIITSSDAQNVEEHKDELSN